MRKGFIRFEKVRRVNVKNPIVSFGKNYRIGINSVAGKHLAGFSSVNLYWNPLDKMVAICPTKSPDQSSFPFRTNVRGGGGYVVSKAFLDEIGVEIKKDPIRIIAEWEEKDGCLYVDLSGHLK